jgi:hypothetical protein
MSISTDEAIIIIYNMIVGGMRAFIEEEQIEPSLAATYVATAVGIYICYGKEMPEGTAIIGRQALDNFRRLHPEAIASIRHEFLHFWREGWLTMADYPYTLQESRRV